MKCEVQQEINYICTERVTVISKWQSHSPIITFLWNIKFASDTKFSRVDSSGRMYSSEGKGNGTLIFLCFLKMSVDRVTRGKWEQESVLR